MASLVVCVDAAQAPGLRSALDAAQRRVLEADGDFDVSQEEATRAASLLLEHQAAWHSAWLSGQVFTSEEAAGDHGADQFAQFSSRYEDLPELPEPARLVVVLTVGLEGEDPGLLGPVHSGEGVKQALTRMLAVAHRGQAALWHLHVVPMSADEDGLWTRFPELVDL